MNAEGTKITGMVAVCSGDDGSVRFDYEIDLAQNKVIYHVKSPWGAMTGFEYAKAKACFDDWCKSL